MICFLKRIRLFFKDESGLSAVEYIVAGTLVIVLLVAGFTALGTTVDSRLLFLRSALSWE